MNIDEVLSRLASGLDSAGAQARGVADKLGDDDSRVGGAFAHLAGALGGAANGLGSGVRWISEKLPDRS